LKKGFVNEIFFIRFVACMCVVLIHSITMTRSNLDVSATTTSVTYLINMSMMFATPVFVMISEFLLSYSYPDRLPKSFWKKRILYILVPYLVLAAVYSMYALGIDGLTWSAFSELFFKKTLLGAWHGYFVLIIFQFYALHFLLKKSFDRFPPLLVIGLALIMNLMYLGFFNFKGTISGLEFMWEYYQLPFLGWFFYFTVAYYAGKHLDEFLFYLKKYRFWVIGGAVFAGIIPIYLRISGVLTAVSSKRFDIIFYTFLVFCVLYLIAMKLNKVPKPVLWISSCSYSIYLLHPLFQYNAVGWFESIQLPSNLVVYILAFFALGVAGPIVMSYLFNLVPFGSLVTGRINMPKLSSSSSQKPAVNKGKAS